MVAILSALWPRYSSGTDKPFHFHIIEAQNLHRLLSGFTVDAQVRGQFKVTSLFCMRTQELESRCSTHPSQELAIEYS